MKPSSHCHTVRPVSLYQRFNFGPRPCRSAAQDTEAGTAYFKSSVIGYHVPKKLIAGLAEVKERGLDHPVSTVTSGGFSYYNTKTCTELSFLFGAIGVNFTCSVWTPAVPCRSSVDALWVGPQSLEFLGQVSHRHKEVPGRSSGVLGSEAADDAAKPSAYGVMSSSWLSRLRIPLASLDKTNGLINTLGYTDCGLWM